MKTIIVHIGPDLDAITSIWLVKTFFPGWIEASIGFVPAGKTLNNLPPDDDHEVLHLDTGFGKFDHHQTDKDICAATLVYEEIKRNSGQNSALERLVHLVNDIDHFKEVYYPNPTADYWDFTLVGQIDGWRLLYAEDPLKVVALGMDSLDAIYKMFQNKIWAEKEIQEHGKEFDSLWGKALGIETVNDEVVHMAQKMGYRIVVRKDPGKGYMRLKSRPDQDIDLTEAYEQYKRDEPEATWFLHASKHMVLNGSSKNPDMKPTKKNLDELIAVLRR
jgi:hypothetical protein